MTNKKMTLSNILWTSIISVICCIHLNTNAFPYSPVRHPIIKSSNNIPITIEQNERQSPFLRQQKIDMTNSQLSEQITLPPPSTAVDANERIVYDPGDGFVKNLITDNVEDYIDMANEPEIPASNNIEDNTEVLRRLEEDLEEEQDIVSKSAFLMKLLEDTNIDALPIMYVENSPPETIFDQLNNLIPIQTEKFLTGVEKRSRYYRRYPWKRHSRNRGTYEPEARYLCVPSKHDVMKLLIELHETRVTGNHQRTVNFCNRKRPAKKVFTNIRFLG